MKRAVSMMLVLFIVLLCGCTNLKSSTQITDTTTDKSVETIQQTAAPHDLEVPYDDITINDSIDISLLAEELEFDLEEWYNKQQYRIAGSDFVWYKTKYPNEEKADMIIEFLYNSETDELKYLIGITILTNKVKTNRGVTIDDDENKLLAAYGSELISGTSDNWYKWYYVGHDWGDKSIHFTIDNNTRKIIEIRISYNRVRAMDELDISSLEC